MNRTGNCDTYFWMKKVDRQLCCIQCDATVYPKVVYLLPKNLNLQYFYYSREQ